VALTGQEEPGTATQSRSAAVALDALVPADHVYRDSGTGKYVVAGTFRQFNVERCPTTLARTVGVFVTLSGLRGAATVDVEFVDAETQEPLVAARTLPVVADDPLIPVDFAVELPPLPLPRPGRYLFRVLVEGRVLGSTAVVVREQEAT
jgi:Family of unknown function (DUF6941)